MIKFNKEPKLNDKEKKYVIEYLKPLLKQNKMFEVREMLLTDVSTSLISDEEYRNIANYLLCHLQDTYFEGYNAILSFEFAEMVGMSSISIPNWVTEILDGAFWGCRDLKNIVIPNSVTYISGEAFQETALKRVVVPKNCDIDDDAFDENVEIIRK